MNDEERAAVIVTLIIVIPACLFFCCLCFGLRHLARSPREEDQSPDQDDAQDRHSRPRDEEELIGLEDLSGAAGRGDRDRDHGQQQQQQQQGVVWEEEGKAGSHQKPIILSPEESAVPLPAPRPVRPWERRLRAVGGVAYDPSPPPRLPSLSPAPSLATMMSSSSSLYSSSSSSSSSSSPSSSSIIFSSYLPQSFSVWTSKVPGLIPILTTAASSGCRRGTQGRKKSKVVRFANEVPPDIVVVPATPELKPPHCPSCNEDDGASAGEGSTASSSTDDEGRAVSTGDGLPLSETRCNLPNTEWQYGRIGTAVSVA